MSMLKLRVNGIEKDAGTYQEMKGIGELIGGARRIIGRKVGGSILGKSLGELKLKAPAIKQVKAMSPESSRLSFYKKLLAAGKATRHDIPIKYHKSLGL